MWQGSIYSAEIDDNFYLEANETKGKSFCLRELMIYLLRLVKTGITDFWLTKLVIIKNLVGIG